MLNLVAEQARSINYSIKGEKVFQILIRGLIVKIVASLVTIIATRYAKNLLVKYIVLSKILATLVAPIFFFC